MKKLVVIGAGMASGRMLEHLFDADPAAYEVTLFNAEPRGNYNRLMLSPVLSGEKTYEEIVTHDEAWYADHKVTISRTFNPSSRSSPRSSGAKRSPASTATARS